MEDILASIRRILSEDESGEAAKAPPPAPVPDVLSLDKSMLVEEAKPMAEPEPEPAEPPDLVAELQPPLPSEPLMGSDATAAAASSMSTLLRTLVSERQNVAVYRGGPTIEDLVREEIRPLLKVWLDSNLPPMVERLVRMEIERVVLRAVS
jgi:cell pole-organizing protein PopZ